MLREKVVLRMNSKTLTWRDFSATFLWWQIRNEVAPGNYRHASNDIGGVRCLGGSCMHHTYSINDIMPLSLSLMHLRHLASEIRTTVYPHDLRPFGVTE